MRFALGAACLAAWEIEIGSEHPACSSLLPGGVQSYSRWICKCFIYEEQHSPSYLHTVLLFTLFQGGAAGRSAVSAPYA